MGLDLVVWVQFVVCGDGESACFRGPEDHSIGLVTAANGDAGEGLGLEVGAGRGGPMEGIVVSTEVTNGAKREESVKVGLSFVEEFKGG